VIAGRHISGGKVYKAGEVVETDRQLDRLFKNKFEQIGGGEPMTKVAVTPTGQVVATKQPKAPETEPEAKVVEDVVAKVADEPKAPETEPEAVPPVRRKKPVRRKSV